MRPSHGVTVGDGVLDVPFPGPVETYVPAVGAGLVPARFGLYCVNALLY